MQESRHKEAGNIWFH